MQAKGATPTSIDAPNDGRAAPDATYLRSRELDPPASPAQRFHIAKAQGTLTGVEAQSAKYAAGLPDNLPAQRRPLPFLFESNGFGVVLHQRARSGAAQPAGVQFPSPRDGGGIGVRLGCRGGAKPGYRQTGVISQQPSEPQQPHRILTAARWLRRHRKARFASGLHRAPTGLRLLRSSGLVFFRR